MNNNIIDSINEIPEKYKEKFNFSLSVFLINVIAIKFNKGQINIIGKIGAVVKFKSKFVIIVFISYIKVILRI